MLALYRVPLAAGSCVGGGERGAGVPPPRPPPPRLPGTGNWFPLLLVPTFPPLLPSLPLVTPRSISSKKYGSWGVMCSNWGLAELARAHCFGEPKGWGYGRRRGFKCSMTDVGRAVPFSFKFFPYLSMRAGEGAAGGLAAPALRPSSGLWGGGRLNA